MGADKPDSVKLDLLDYAIFGVLAAAKFETGPEGARRMFRIQTRLGDIDGGWNDERVAASLAKLMGLGMVREDDKSGASFGYIYFSANVIIAPGTWLPTTPASLVEIHSDGSLWIDGVRQEDEPDGR